MAFAHGTASILFYPARTALLPGLVERDQLLRANGMLQVGDTAARLVGPTASGRESARGVTCGRAFATRSPADCCKA